MIYFFNYYRRRSFQLTVLDPIFSWFFIWVCVHRRWFFKQLDVQTLLQCFVNLLYHLLCFKRRASRPFSRAFFILNHSALKLFRFQLQPRICSVDENFFLIWWWDVFERLHLRSLVFCRWFNYRVKTLTRSVLMLLKFLLSFYSLVAIKFYLNSLTLSF